MIAVLKQRTYKHFSKLSLRLKNRFSKKTQLTDYYFGYGANLSLSRFTNNFMNAQEIGNASLLDHELEFSLATDWIDKSYAGVHSKKGSIVPGVLFKTYL